MKIILQVLGICFLLQIVNVFSSFNKECKHIYVAVEQPEVKMPQAPNSVIAIYTAPPSGKHEGEELVCVKCFHTRKQIIDYGVWDKSLMLSGVAVDTLAFKPVFLGSSGTLLKDTITIKQK